jgi:hypothetical protein
MPAFVWITNHRMWKVVAPFSESFDVLKAYITDPSAYVYWSTPRHIDEIKPGDTAYIFRSVDRAGIVARGVVEEAPRHLSAASAASFRLSGAPDAARLGRKRRALGVEDRDTDRADVLGRAGRDGPERAWCGRAVERG